MRIQKKDAPVRIDVPGATARQELDFGDATGYGKISGEHYALTAGTDFAPCSKACRTISANVPTGDT